METASQHYRQAELPTDIACSVIWSRCLFCVGLDHVEKKKKQIHHTRGSVDIMNSNHNLIQCIILTRHLDCISVSLHCCISFSDFSVVLHVENS